MMVLNDLLRVNISVIQLLLISQEIMEFLPQMYNNEYLMLNRVPLFEVVHISMHE